ncbi:copper resistance protein CopC [Streptomyces sp. J2-1]|uniref:copper resistance CopC/CopD family protein n=1 Tax=Streptomyces corallincola TaxID=2851888 RepID=UPI001C39539D|nr:copper resistance CopC family protein [Streptomyces corallincola]MBV2356904.1 copper resistance protein CopC [Streptomyces corallincola]
MGHQHRRRRRLCTLGVVLLLLLLGTAAPASAHAALRATSPADGSVVRTAPRQLTLAYSESVGLLTDSLRVYDPRNHRVRTPEPDHVPGHPDTLRLALPRGLGKGTYTVAWRVVSADSHPVSGALTFSVGERTATAAVLPDRSGNAVTTGLYNVARYLAYLAVALLIGAAVLVAYCRPPGAARLRGAVLGAWWVLAAATGALFLLRAPYEEGTSPVSLTGGALARAAASRPGELLLVRLALLVVIAVCALAVRRWSVPRAAVGVVGVVLASALALTWAAAEHASAGIQVPVAVASATLHLLAVGVWLGGLGSLLVLLRAGDEGAAGGMGPVVGRFSRLAFGAVVVLVVTGVYQSWRGLGSWAALLDTEYGRILLAKVVGVALLLVVASGARRLVRAGAGAGFDAGAGVGFDAGSGGEETLFAVRRLRRLVLGEAALGVVVLLLSTLLAGTLPSRAEAEARGAAPVAGIPAALVTTVPFSVEGASGGRARGKVQVTLDSGRVGVNSVQAVVYGANGGLASVPELRITMTLGERGVGPLDTKVVDRGGYWGADAFSLPMEGVWTMRVSVRVSETDQVTVVRGVRVRR